MSPDTALSIKVFLFCAWSTVAYDQCLAVSDSEDTNPTDIKGKKK